LDDVVTVARHLAAEAAGLTGLDFSTERVLDLAGVFVFAVSGALAAVRKRFDIVGVAALAIVTAVGGGIIRDVLLGERPPAALRDVWYLLVPIGAAVITMWWHGTLLQMQRSILVFDAAGLGLFCVTGAIKSVDAGLNLVAAIGLGVITATGGGILRDVLSGEQPLIFRANTVLYAIPAAFGAALVALAWRADLGSAPLALAIAAAVFLFRMAALRYGWKAPVPRGVRGDPGPSEMAP
jgi:uncharacterized membrane protein YeiH